MTERILRCYPPCKTCGGIWIVVCLAGGAISFLIVRSSSTHGPAGSIIYISIHAIDRSVSTRIDSDFNFVYGNFVTHKLWKLMKTEFWGDICWKIQRFYFFFGVKCVIFPRSSKSGAQPIVIRFDIGKETWHTFSKIALRCFR